MEDVYGDKEGRLDVAGRSCTVTPSGMEVGEGHVHVRKILSSFLREGIFLLS
jgi:hypothetical protein